MALETVKAKVDSGPYAGREVEVQYDFGGNLQEATKMHGEGAVFERYHAAAVIDLQAYLRSQIKQGAAETHKEKDKEGKETTVIDKVTENAQAMQKRVLEAVKAWKLGEKKQRGTTKVEKVKNLLDGMSPEQREEALRELGLA